MNNYTGECMQAVTLKETLSCTFSETVSILCLQPRNSLLPLHRFCQNSLENFCMFICPCNTNKNIKVSIYSQTVQTLYILKNKDKTEFLLFVRADRREAETVYNSEAIIIPKSKGQQVDDLTCACGMKLL